MYQMVCAIGSIASWLRQHLRQVDRGAGAQQAVVVVDEVRVAVVDPLVIRHVGVRRVDAHALGDDLGQRPAGADQIVVDLAGALLVAHQDALFQLGVEAACLGAIRRGRRLHVHLGSSGILRVCARSYA